MYCRYLGHLSAFVDCHVFFQVREAATSSNPRVLRSPNKDATDHRPNLVAIPRRPYTQATSDGRHTYCFTPSSDDGLVIPSQTSRLLLSQTMASSDEAVEQSLSSRTATPIAQLNPDLIDQATRKVHGEITITWPYSFVTKTFAFLLAESDFRLRRNKGQVRIQLKGPSAEAVGKLELGSGDEVTLALDGVEWAKDEESARPAGSRSEWQLKFAGKLMLKVGSIFENSMGHRLTSTGYTRRDSGNESRQHRPARSHHSSRGAQSHPVRRDRSHNFRCAACCKGAPYSSCSSQ